jgi:hypothetical protein
MLRMRKLHRLGAPGAAALLLASLSLGAAGCTLLFDPDDLRPGGGPGPIDPGALELIALSPAAVDEGLGVVRPVPVVIQGRNLAPGAMVRLSGPSQDATLRPLQVARNGTLAAFELAIPVQPTLGDGATDAVLVEVFQGNGVTRSLTLTINGLDELVATQFGPSRNFTLISEQLKPRYSRIDIDADLASAGQQPVRLVATAEIALSRSLSADGGDGDIDSEGQPGPGGCGGGAERENGACGEGGGQGGADDSPGGGGGGGHAAGGTSGSNTGSGAGGLVSGNPTLVPLELERGNGGGGGGRSGSGGDGSGGGGGGGGGTIELTSLGSFRILSGARISVQGGDGGGCDGSGAGGGGGGSGGTILVRAAGSIEDSGGGTLVIGGGGGGLGGCSGLGGAGAVGRVRVDAPALPPSTLSASPYHGAVLDPATPVIVRASTLTVAVLGRAAQSYAVASPMTSPRTLQTDSSGRGTQSVTLVPGINRVCAIMTPGGARLADGENCLDVAYLP